MKRNDRTAGFDDWKVIIAFGLIFSSTLSTLAYLLVGEFALTGVIFGSFLAISICACSVVLITILNRDIIPKINEKYVVVMSIIFSFFSGFLGTLFAYLIAAGLDIKMLETFEKNVIVFATLIGILTYLIGDLFSRIVSLENRRDANDQLVINSRLKSLETQLNPHFIFNCLNSIAELVYHDSRKAEDMILKLSRFLRATMKENSVLPLGDEIKNVSRYISLENVRFNNKITLIVNCDESFNDILIPKFSIQLLAENAIKHGYDRKSNNFIIKVEVSEDDESYFIKVSNTGKKIDNFRPGIGMKNLNERLRYLCNGSISLEKNVEPTFIIKFGECNENCGS